MSGESNDQNDGRGNLGGVFSTPLGNIDRRRISQSVGKTSRRNATNRADERLDESIDRTHFLQLFSVEQNHLRNPFGASATRAEIVEKRENSQSRNVQRGVFPRRAERILQFVERKFRRRRETTANGHFSDRPISSPAEHDEKRFRDDFIDDRLVDGRDRSRVARVDLFADRSAVEPNAQRGGASRSIESARTNLFAADRSFVVERNEDFSPENHQRRHSVGPSLRTGTSATPIGNESHRFRRHHFRFVPQRAERRHRPGNSSNHYQFESVENFRFRRRRKPNERLV